MGGPCRSLLGPSGNFGEPWGNPCTWGNWEGWGTLFLLGGGSPLGEPWGKLGKLRGTLGILWGTRGEPWVGEPGGSLGKPPASYGEPWGNPGKPWVNLGQLGRGRTLGEPWGTLGEPPRVIGNPGSLQPAGRGTPGHEGGPGEEISHLGTNAEPVNPLQIHVVTPACLWQNLC